LDQAGLIESQLQQPEGKGPARKVYHITQQGRQAHIKGAIKALSVPQRGSSPLLLGLSSFPLVPCEQVLEALAVYAGKIEERMDHMRRQAEGQRPLPPFVQAMFDYSQALAEAELKWIRNFIREVEDGNV
jgi:DNA-binding PadR family transcriptional regulator